MSENRKVIHIRYIDKYVENEAGVKLPEFKNLKLTTSHTKRYHNCLYLLADLKGCARNLMDFLAETMDVDNAVCSNNHTIQKFIDEMKSANVEYGVDSVNKAFKKLKDKGFLIPIVRGMYMVNPKYFVKNDDAKRENLIRLSLDFGKDLDIPINVEIK